MGSPRPGHLHHRRIDVLNELSQGGMEKHAALQKAQLAEREVVKRRYGKRPALLLGCVCPGGTLNLFATFAFVMCARTVSF